MQEDKPKPDGFDELRRRAEELLSKKKVKDMTDTDALAWVHELRVHQIELEMQNEELKRSRQELEESRSKYLELYEFSPIGYFTLDKQVRLKDELFQAQKLASVGKLAGGVAHNFNNLLTVVMGYASLLLSELKDDNPLIDFVYKRGYRRKLSG